MAEPAVFLDRDGTLIEEVGYPTRPEQIRILGGVARALARLSAAGYKLIVITNQSAIARGLMTEEDLHRFHQALDEQLDLLGARLDAYYACPHHPDAGGGSRSDLAVDCDCRKPKPGLILRAAADLDIDLARSWLVGDAWRDVAAGQAAGLRTIKLPSGAAQDSPRPADVPAPTAEAAGLDEAASIILRTPGGADDGPPQAAQAEGPPAPPPADVPPDQPASDAALETAAGVPSAAPSEEAAAAALSATEPVCAEPEPESKPVAREAPVIAPPKAPAPVARSTCARCGLDVAESDLQSGAAGHRHGLLLCGECLARFPPEGEAAIGDRTTDLLRPILLELRHLGRMRRSGNFTLLRLLAYLVQGAALFCGLALGLVSDDKMLYLQIAILLQLVVVSILLLERHS